jgi:hypothetical protein
MILIFLGALTGKGMLFASKQYSIANYRTIYPLKDIVGLGEPQ